MKKILGGAFLISGLYDDYISNTIDKKKVLARLDLIDRYESGDLSLQELNKIW